MALRSLYSPCPRPIYFPSFCNIPGQKIALSYKNPCFATICLSWPFDSRPMGQRVGTTTTTAPPTSVSSPAMHSGGSIDGKKSRERAITVAGDEARSKPPTPTSGSSGGVNTNPSPPLASPPSLSWRASTGRHDLSQRQLVLLKEMQNNPIRPSLSRI
jgi:hypothetical protein